MPILSCVYCSFSLLPSDICYNGRRSGGFRPLPPPRYLRLCLLGFRRFRGFSLLQIASAIDTSNPMSHSQSARSIFFSPPDYIIYYVATKIKCFLNFYIKNRPPRIYWKAFCLFLTQFGKSVLNCLYDIVYRRINDSQINSITNLHPYGLSRFDFCL